MIKLANREWDDMPVTVTMVNGDVHDGWVFVDEGFNGVRGRNVWTSKVALKYNGDAISVLPPEKLETAFNRFKSAVNKDWRGCCPEAVGEHLIATITQK